MKKNKKNRRVILVLSDIYKRGTLRDYLLFLAQKERKHIQQDEINKLNKSDVISSVSESGIRLDLDKMLKAKDTFKNIL